MLSDTVVHEFIRAWKRSVFGDPPGWPAESVIAKVVKYLTRLDPSPPSVGLITDADVMAQIVSAMRSQAPEIYQSFVAYHLGVIGDQRHNNKRYKERAALLGIAGRTFRDRRQAGFEFCRRHLTAALVRNAAFLL